MPRLALPFFLLAACGGEIASHEEATEESIRLMEEMVDILDDVKDSETARKAAASMRGLAERAQSLAERMKELPELAEEQEEELRRKYGAKLAEVTDRLRKVGQNAMRDPALQEAFEELGKAMQEMS